MFIINLLLSKILKKKKSEKYRKFKIMKTGTDKNIIKIMKKLQGNDDAFIYLGVML